MQKDFSEELEIFKNNLKKHSLKATPQRMAVHKAMLCLGHASADTVVENIRKNSEATVTVASVYNILTQLADLGIYSRRFSSNNKMYFDVTNTRHIHIYDCERHIYKDFMDDELLEIIESKLKKKKFRGLSIESIDIQIVARPTKKVLGLRQ
ncbi:MAG: Fur family transcriptional regulator [Candidatus Cryptobacteroides sp.]